MNDDPYDRLGRRLDGYAERQVGNLADHPKRTAAKWIGILVGGILLLSLAGSLVANATGIASIYWNAEKAKITAKPRVTSAIYQTENIIAKVDKFHRLCTNVNKDLAIFKNNQAKYDADLKAAQLQTDPVQKQVEINSLSQESQDSTAALNIAQQDAADYNSASAQYTQFPFKDHSLPDRINLPAGLDAAYTFNLNCG